MYKITTTNGFERNVALCLKRGYNLQLLQKAVKQL
jgi:hypothetical protein